MKKQIRIYYECLEQGLHYIKPIIEHILDKKEAEIVLIRQPKRAKSLNSGSIEAIQTMTTPDALVTGIVNGKEYPLVLIEFTKAVITEDHELQRTYGAVAAHLSGAYYLKLAGEKYSEKEFGGAKYNPFSTPKIFIDEVGYEGYIIAKWETKKDNKYTLQCNSTYPSCPPDIAIFTATLQSVVSTFIISEKEWFSKSLAKLKKDKSYQSYRKQVEAATGIKELMEIWKARRAGNLNKVRFFVEPGLVKVKINRFSHAMDPERGILTFTSFFLSKTRKVFGIYALKRTSAELKIDINSISTMRKQLKIALDIDRKAGGSVPEWFENLLIKKANKATMLEDSIDITSDLLQSQDELSRNKVMSTIIYFLDGIYLNHNGIRLEWDKRKLVNSTNKDFSNYTKPTPIIEVINGVDEDEVTYTILHKVLIPNGFQIVSVSYPGSQGDGAVLPNPELGKAQSRKYPDIIALPPICSKIDVMLNESKGMFSKTDIEKDLKKILCYKDDPKLKTALKETLLVAQVIDKNKQLKSIVIGVSFGLKNGRTTDWQPNKVDFIFRIVDRKLWAIGIFNQELKSLINTIEGSTDLPTVFELKKGDLL
jgi:hypothetical protein